MTLESEDLLKSPEKLPSYMMQMSDDYSFHLALKIVISVIKFLPSYEKHDYEFSESDRDILIGILAPHILNKQTSDDENEISIDGNENQPSEIKIPQNFNDCLTFADIENQTFLELIEKECFLLTPDKEEEDEKYVNINPDEEISDEQKINKEHFIPYFK